MQPKKQCWLMLNSFPIIVLAFLLVPLCFLYPHICADKTKSSQKKWQYCLEPELHCVTRKNRTCILFISWFILKFILSSENKNVFIITLVLNLPNNYDELKVLGNLYMHYNVIMFPHMVITIVLKIGGIEQFIFKNVYNCYSIYIISNPMNMQHLFNRH